MLFIIYGQIFSISANELKKFSLNEKYYVFRKVLRFCGNGTYSRDPVVVFFEKSVIQSITLLRKWDLYCWDKRSGVTSLTWSRPKSFFKSSGAPLSITVILLRISREIWELQQNCSSSFPSPSRCAIQMLDRCRWRCSISSSIASCVSRTKLAAFS